MNRRTVVLIVTAWIVSLVGIGVWAQEWRPTSPQRTVNPGEAVGPLITGENIAFQPVASLHNDKGKVVGKLMVRVNGVWLEAQPPVTVVR